MNCSTILEPYDPKLAEFQMATSSTPTQDTMSDTSSIDMSPQGSPSYLYTSDGKDYLFPQDVMEEQSLIPSFHLEHMQIIFTFHDAYALYVDHSFIYSVDELMRKINSSVEINQDFLDKIAIIINFLANGDLYTYVERSVSLKEASFSFLVQRGDSFYNVSVASITQKSVVHYQQTEVIFV